MFFLLRMAFWFGLVLMLLPSGGGQHRASTHDTGAADLISATSAAVHDLRGFCAREPDACTVGSQLAADVWYHARACARRLYNFMSGALAERHEGSSGGSQKQLVRSRTPPSENTLTPTDFAPAWRGWPLHDGAAHSP